MAQSEVAGDASAEDSTHEQAGAAADCSEWALRHELFNFSGLSMVRMSDDGHA
jgi:hypothetical protein